MNKPVIWPLVVMMLTADDDLIAMRQRARQIAAALGFDGQDQVRIATAVSEIGRNALAYGRNGRVEFAVDGVATPQSLLMTVTDSGPGIADLDSIWAGTYRSATGMGVGMIGARRLMDALEVETAPGVGTRVRMRKALPRRSAPMTRQALGDLAAVLARDAPRDVHAELREQNRDLMRSLEEQRRQQEELRALNSELEQTNRGVLALYMELEDKATALRDANEVKTRFLSNVSHELRTPIQSVMAIGRLLLDRVDGDLSVEQERQVRLVYDSVRNLSGIVDTLLDLAKVEAGRMDVRLRSFAAGDLLGSVRGLFKPLHASTSVALVFEDCSPIRMYSDEGKVNQILRNLISNALKFTRHGEVRISARLDPAGDEVVFAVQDSGIGIAPKDQARVFEDFEQIPGPLQQAAKGTGLGLPITRKLAELLGGVVTLVSAPDVGSTFSVTLPRRFSGILRTGTPPSIRLEGPRDLLVIDDDASWRYILSQAGRANGLVVHEAAGGREGVRMAHELVPDLVFLDLLMPDMDGYAVLAELRADVATRDIPVVLISGSTPEWAAERGNLSHVLTILPKSESVAVAVESLLGGHVGHV